MLSRTFLFLPGIGPVREKRLWRRGVSSWDDYRALGRVQGIRPRVKERHDQLLDVASAALGRDPAFFARALPAAEQWRAYASFRAKAAYLDIETRGERENNDVTVVGIRKGETSHLFVRGLDYSPAAVTDFLRDASCIVTFNGATFDLPVLAAEGVHLPSVPSVDLRVVLNRAGYEGGLKRIEEALGLLRDPAVRGMSGYDAVKLWRRWERDHEKEALDKLLAYNAADFENLVPLADFACDALEKKLLADVRAQARLPLSLAEAAPAGP